MTLGLEVSNVTKLFGQRVALQEVTFSLEEGKTAAIVGPSGSGKSTLLNVISGFYEVSSGSVAIDGKPVERCGKSSPLLHLKPVERNVGYVFQDLVLFPHMTVFENVAFGLRAHHLPDSMVKSRVANILDKVGIKELRERKPSQISGGQMQRVAVARALVLEPKVLLLDEPLSALDNITRENVRLELKNIFENLGTTVVYVTHDLDEAFFLGSEIGIIQSGRMMFYGHKDELFNEMNRTTAEFLGFNVIDVELRGARGASREMLIPGWNMETEIPILNRVDDSQGQESVLAVHPRSVRIHSIENEESTKGFRIHQIQEFKDSVRVNLDNSGNKLTAEIPSLEFRKLDFKPGQKTEVSFDAGFLLKK